MLGLNLQEKRKGFERYLFDPVCLILIIDSCRRKHDEVTDKMLDS